MKTFTTSQGHVLPVDDAQYLEPFLSPTSKGTHYREALKEADLLDRQKGRILLQVHQILHLFQQFGIDLDGKSLLDIGTGNGLVPCMLLELSALQKAVGSDPFLDGEHQTSWQKHDHNKALQELSDFLQQTCKDNLSYSSYQHLTEFEHHTMRPMDICLPIRAAQKDYRFSQVDGAKLEDIGETFDILYCKAIEHISDISGVFRSSAAVANKNAVLYFKHRSFFSYLGPHRYASIGIPWGHLLLSEGDYVRYVKQFHPEQSAQMIEFYFHGLAYPRFTISDMLRRAQEHGWLPVVVLSEPPRYLKQAVAGLEDIPGFWNIVWSHYPHLSVDEVFSGIYHLIFVKE